MPAQFRPDLCGEWKVSRHSITPIQVQDEPVRKCNKIKMFSLSKFQADEEGAITVDWVVLTGAVIGILLGIVAVIFGFLGAAEAKINDTVADNDLGIYSGQDS